MSPERSVAQRPAPRIDQRSYDDLVRQTERLLYEYVGWKKDPTGDADPVEALVHVFARFGEIAVDRLNRVPERHFLAFLDLLGLSLMPPRAARVPVTFTLAGGGPEHARVPAGTRLAAPADEDHPEELLFEVERAVNLTPALLKAAFVLEPGADRYAQLDEDRVTEGLDGAFVFHGDRPLEHALYLAHDELLRPSELGDLTVTVQTKDPRRWERLPLIWSYSTPDGWADVAAAQISSVRPENGAFSVTLRRLPALEPQEVNGVVARWIRMRVGSPLTPGQASTTQADGIVLTAQSRRDEDDGKLLPDVGFSGSAPLDVTKDFRPFGERPRTGDAFYFSSREALGQGTGTVRVHVELGDAGNPVNPSVDLQLEWEVWDGAAWRSVAVRTPGTRVSPGRSPALFTADGTVEFDVAGSLKPHTLHGHTGYWVRVRIVRGNYGSAASYRLESGGAAGGSQFAFVPESFGPPLVRALTLGYTLSESGTPTLCITRNGFVYQDQTERMHGGGGFKPFPESGEEHSALFLGFDRPFPNRTTALYLGLVPSLYQAGGDSPQSVPERPRVVWEYAGPGGWRDLGAHDETETLTRSGLVSFVGPADFSERSEFGRSLYWLRARLDRGEFEHDPRLERLLTNTTWARGAQSISREVIGASNGQALQRFTTVHRPVLADAVVEVRESLRADSEDWHEWRQVPDFHGSTARDHHFVLDHVTGEITFGDGLRGRIPPRGRGNIRISYRTGGGAAGNVTPGRIRTLKTTVPYVDGVINYESGMGGADGESIDALKERGPRSLRHRDRAVAPGDFEDLALEASAEVALARAVSAHGSGDSGKVGLIIVAHGDAERPDPSISLVRTVEAYVRERTIPTVDLWVGGPRWLQVDVTAEIVPASLDDADDLAPALRRALDAYLHPISGGRGGRGWPFGARPSRSDIYAVLGAVDGVDHVAYLDVRTKDVEEDGGPAESRLVSSGDHHITLRSASGGV